MKTHEHENNQESQRHLNENKKHFSAQCLKVLQLFMDGKRLTVKSAITVYEIWSLPRRVLDLKENGIDVCDEWITDKDGKTKIKQYFLNPKSENEKRELQKWFYNFQEEQPESRFTQQNLF